MTEQGAKLSLTEAITIPHEAIMPEVADSGKVSITKFGTLKVPNDLLLKCQFLIKINPNDLLPREFCLWGTFGAVKECYLIKEKGDKPLYLAINYYLPHRGNLYYVLGFEDPEFCNWVSSADPDPIQIFERILPNLSYKTPQRLIGEIPYGREKRKVDLVSHISYEEPEEALMMGEWIIEKYGSAESLAPQIHPLVEQLQHKPRAATWNLGELDNLVEPKAGNFMVVEPVRLGGVQIIKNASIVSHSRLVFSIEQNDFENRPKWITRDAFSYLPDKPNVLVVRRIGGGTKVLPYTTYSDFRLRGGI